jgi:hypothetical protein
MTYKPKFNFFRKYQDYLKDVEREKRDCAAWAEENASVIDALKAKLLVIAGSQVSPEPHPFLVEVVAHGEHIDIDIPVKYRRMRRSRCHENVAAIWQQRTKRTRLKAIVTGYAMADDNGIWLPHSWGLTNKYILETTVGREDYFSEYFGIIMDGEDADAFATGRVPETASRFFIPSENQGTNGVAFAWKCRQP